METGAVKQAYNNEVILLKKNLNQARTQIIHKLTRKAKQLTEKKCPEALKEKLRRKAEIAVKEVLAIKKIKARDLGKFIITHKGKLQDYLNKPQVDNNRACARILLHKSMQEKYKFIRNRFLNVPIKDLFMSRQERLQLRKDERLKNKEKQKKKKGKVINAEGDWDVQDVNVNKPEEKKDTRKKVAKNVSDDEQDDQDMSNDDVDDISEEEEEQTSKNNEESSEEGESGKECELSKEKVGSDEEQEGSGEEQNGSAEEQEVSGDENEEEENSDNEGFESGSDQDTVAKGFKISFKGQSDQESDDEMDDDTEKDFGKFVKCPPVKPEKKSKVPTKKSAKKSKENKNVLVAKELPFSIESKIKSIQKSNLKKDTSKNKKLNDKILNKKFKKGFNDAPDTEKKVIDPFFVTETGENYLSIAEARAPDEIKEEHIQGNRKIRRAVMFGHVPRIKPRQSFRQDNNGFRENVNTKFDSRDKFQRGSDTFNTFNDNKKHRFNDRSEQFNERRKQDDKPEKLHPSWEAKKKLSSILPYQGKKIVFDDS